MRKVMMLVAAIVMLCAVVGTGMSASAAEKPNIVYLFADQWRASATGYAGDPNVKTPTLDRLAKESVNFRNAVSVCPVCTPYRAALMTGRYQMEAGIGIPYTKDVKRK